MQIGLTLANGTAAQKRTINRLMEAEIEDCAEILIDLETAVRFLWLNELTGKRLAEAVAEVDERTKGMPYRIETSIGPLLAQQAVWRHAGRSGDVLRDDVATYHGVPTVPRPTWSGNWRPVSEHEKRRIVKAWRARIRVRKPAPKQATAVAA
jgi:hypothetical protein